MKKKYLIVVSVIIHLPPISLSGDIKRESCKSITKLTKGEKFKGA